MISPPVRPAPSGALLVLAGAVLWGTTGTAQALGPESATPLAVGATRLVAGGLLLVLYTRWAPGVVRHRGGMAALGVTRERVVAGLAGAVGVAVYQASFFAAVDVAGVALGTAVAIGSAPVFTGLLEWASAGRRPTGRWWTATGMAGFGVMVLAGPSAVVPRGVLLALVAGACYAVYAVTAKRLLDTGMSGPASMAVVFGLGGLLIAPALVVVDLSWLATGAGVVMVSWLAGVTILVAYLLFGAGLRAVRAATAATSSLAEPLTAAVLGVAVLGERPSGPAMAGAGLVLVGLVVLLTRLRAPVPAPG